MAALRHMSLNLGRRILGLQQQLGELPSIRRIGSSSVPSFTPASAGVARLVYPYTKSFNLS